MESVTSNDKEVVLLDVTSSVSDCVAVKVTSYVPIKEGV